MEDDIIISSSPRNRKSQSFRDKRKKKFHLSSTFNSEALDSQGFHPQSTQDYFEDEYDLILADFVNPPSKPKTITSKLLSQKFVNLENLIEKETFGPVEHIENCPTSTRNAESLTSRNQEFSVINQILRDFELSPVKIPSKPSFSLRKEDIIYTYSRVKQKQKVDESDCESSISWQEEEIVKEKSPQNENFNKILAFEKLLNLSNYFENDSDSIDLECTQAVCPATISLKISYNFPDENNFESSLSEDYSPEKYNDFYDHVFDGVPSGNLRLFETDDLEEVSADEPNHSNDLNMLWGNTEMFAEVSTQELQPLTTKDKNDNFNILCGNTELFTKICFEEDPQNQESFKKPSAKRKLKLGIETSSAKTVKFDVDILNTSKCNIEDEEYQFEGFIGNVNDNGDIFNFEGLPREKFRLENKFTGNMKTFKETGKFIKKLFFNI